MTTHHRPVLLSECLTGLDPKPGEVWVDCTLGCAGHSLKICERIGLNGRLIGIDQDPAMLAIAKEQLADRANAVLLHANFDQLPIVLEQQSIRQVDGVIADLGFCSDQLADPQRGLSFQKDGPLDMRLDTTISGTAADLVNTQSEQVLADILFEYGEERKSRWIAKKIVERRSKQKFATTQDLANLVRQCVPRQGGIDPATRTFQALRIAVNDELGALDRLLSSLPSIVKPGGRVGMISFHSLEDRRVKNAFKESDIWLSVYKKPIEATASEIAQNPRSRSAKLRVAIRTT